MRRLIAVLLLACSACMPSLTPQDAKDLASVEAQIQECIARGRSAHSYEVYDSCMKEKGLHQ